MSDLRCRCQPQNGKGIERYCMTDNLEIDGDVQDPDILLVDNYRQHEAVCFALTFAHQERPG